MSFTHHPCTIEAMLNRQEPLLQCCKRKAGWPPKGTSTGMGDTYRTANLLAALHRSLEHLHALDFLADLHAKSCVSTLFHQFHAACCNTLTCSTIMPLSNLHLCSTLHAGAGSNLVLYV